MFNLLMIPQTLVYASSFQSEIDSFSSMPNIVEEDYNDIKNLVLSNNKIHRSDIDPLVKIFGTLKNPESLDVSNNNISGDYFRILLKAMKTKTLKEFDASDSNINCLEMIGLADALKDHKDLVKLNLRNNKISDYGVEALAEAINDLKFLKELNLSNNSISNNGIASLANALKNTMIERLNLSNNKFDSQAIEAFAGTLKNLKELDLSNNSFDEAGVEKLAKILEESNSLTDLYLIRLDPYSCKPLVNLKKKFKDLKIHLERQQ